VIFYGGIFQRLSCLKLLLCGSSTHHHVQVAPLSMVLPLVEVSLLVCSCLVSGWHKLWAFTHFLDNEDYTTPDIRGFPISHEKQIMNYR
jgi:hypothetical protein